MNVQSMPGTLTPEQMQVKALIESLRQAPMQGQQSAPQQGQVVSANVANPGAAIDPIMQRLGGMAQNVGTAMQYGTNPFSQQTSMLAAQDAAFR